MMIEKEGPVIQAIILDIQRGENQNPLKTFPRNSTSCNHKSFSCQVWPIIFGKSLMDPLLLMKKDLAIHVTEN